MSDRLLKIVFGNSFEVQETPDGWQDITDSITAIKEYDAVLETHEGQLTFKEDGYDYLINKFDTFGWTHEEPCELYQYIDGVYERFSVGLIKFSDLEIIRRQRNIKVKVLDNAFYSKINNNKTVEAFLWAGRSKNDVDIIPTPLSDISFFTPSTGVYITPPAPPYSSKGYRINDVFRYLVDFMSDGTVDYDSSLFGVGGEFEGLSISCGFVVSTVGSSGTTEVQFKDNFPPLAFDTVFKEVKKKRNIGFYVDNTGAKPKLKIEYVSDLKINTQGHSDNTILEIKEIVTPENNYSSVRVGANEITELVQPAIQFPSDAVFVGWPAESYPVEGNTNVDRQLDLVSNWIIDGGIIEDLIVNNINDFDEEIILIDCDSVGIAVQSPVDEQTTTAPFYYNKAFTNRGVIENYFGGIPNTLALYLGQSSDKFKASLTIDAVPFLGYIEPVPYQNDSNGGNFDTNNNFDAINYFEFVVPSSGAYTFHTWHSITTNLFTSSSLSRDIEVQLRVYDTGGFFVGSLLSTHIVVTKSIINRPAQTDILSASKTLILTATQTVLVRIRTTTTDCVVNPGSYFACVETHDSGIVSTVDNGEYFNINHQFDSKLTPAQYKTIASDVRKYISFSEFNERPQFGWIQSLKYKRFAGTAQFTTITTKNNTR